MAKPKNWESERPTLWTDMSKDRKLYRAVQRECATRGIGAAVLVRMALKAFLDKPCER